MYEERKYRNLFKAANLEYFNVCVRETDLQIAAHSNLHDLALSLVRKYRLQLEVYIKLQPVFLTSLVPVSPLPGAPDIAISMCEAAKKAGVGPMAAVAGAISEAVGKELLKHSPEVIVENGGDIFIKTNSVRKIGIYAGLSPLSQKIAVEIEPGRTPVGICTSSGTVGHSLSFGKADAAVILARDAALADAAATALGNHVKCADDMERALEFAASIEGVEGALVIVGDRLAAWGDITLAKM